MVLCAWNLRAGRWQPEGKFRIILSYISSSRPPWTTWDCVSKTWKEGEPGDIVQVVKCLPLKHEDPVLILCQKAGCGHTCCKHFREAGGSLGLLCSQPSLLGELWDKWETLFQTRWMAPLEQHLRLTLGLHTHIHVVGLWRWISNVLASTRT